MPEDSSISRTLLDRNDATRAVHAIMAPKGVPKRKSLTGLFGLALKKSIDKLRGTSTSEAIAELNDRDVLPELKSLAEEMKDAEPIKPFCPPSPPYRSRFGDNALAEVPRPARASREFAYT